MAEMAPSEAFPSFFPVGLLWLEPMAAGGRGVGWAEAKARSLLVPQAPVPLLDSTSLRLLLSRQGDHSWRPPAPPPCEAAPVYLPAPEKEGTRDRGEEPRPRAPQPREPAQGTGSPQSGYKPHRWRLC
mmetsp:Transcript_12470/g.36100  ORF Transcript_12470/g.36100 Transcript_12470/m.36100 type:complete len:128 (-) Transcript_12470:105-488(-)